MSDPFAHVQPGDDLAIPAEGWNGAMDAARAHRLRGHNQMPGLRPVPRIRKQRACNQTGYALDRYGVVGLDVPRILPSDNESEFLRVELWDAVAYDIRLHGMHRIGVMLEPSPDNNILARKIQTSGTIRMPITVNDESHTHCLPVDAGGFGGGTTLQTSDQGFTIRWKESGTGTKWADIVLDDPGGWTLCKASLAIPAESLFVMDSTSTVTVGSETVEFIKATLTLTGYGDTLHPSSVLGVSPGYDLATNDYFLAREYWPRWVRTSAAATVNGCVGHDESGGGAADPWLPGYRVIAIDGTTRALVVPDDGYSVGVLATDVSSGKATAKLVEISAGVGTAKSKTFDVHAFESLA